MKRRTIEEARRWFESVGLELLESEYKSVDTPMKCRNKDGYLFNRSLRTVEDSKDKNQAYCKPFSIRNTYFWDNIQFFMKNYVDTGTKLLTEKENYKDGNNKLTFLCGRCNKTFKTTWSAFSKLDNKVCPACYREIRYNADYVENRRNSLSTYQNKASELGLILLSENIKSCREKIEVQDSEGYKGTINASRLLNGSSFEKFSVRNPYSLYNIRLLLKKRNSSSYVYDQEFKGSGYSLKVRCGCGKDFEVGIDHLIYEKKDRCNECRVKQSNIANTVETWLKTNNVSYVKEKIFEGCRGIKGKLLQFDFYVAEKNICIEVDGLQHFKPVMWHNITKEQAEENFRTLQANDNVKNKFCLTNGITLIRLPFWEIENSERYIEILSNFFPSEGSDFR